MTKRSATVGGILYVVATPIGNLEDITARAITTLQNVDMILAEDTRHSGQLLHALNIKKPLFALHDHNEAEKCEALIMALQQGQNIALISDAGTPLISDPGFILVRQARLSGVQVVPVPGPCALITALQGAGVPCNHFLFLGFLPAKKQARREQLVAIQEEAYTVILYESTHRIIDCLEDILDLFGETYQMALAKELTKTFEHIMFATVSDIKTWLLDDAHHVKGEFVLILPAVPKAENEFKDEKLLKILLGEVPLKQAVKIASMISDTPKNELYKMALLNLEKK